MSPVGKEVTKHETTKTNGSSSACSSKPDSSGQGVLETNIKPHCPSLSYEAERMPDASHTTLSDHSSFTNFENFITIDEANITSSSHDSSSLSRMARVLSATVDHPGNHRWPSYPRHNQSHKNSTPNRARYTTGNSHRQQSSNKVIFGKGKSTGIRAINDRSKQSNGNKSITGTFISRLDPRTTSRGLALYIHREFGLTVRPEKLTNRSGLCSSFYIPGNRVLRQKLMDADMWPEGTLIKPFVQY